MKLLACIALLVTCCNADGQGVGAPAAGPAPVALVATTRRSTDTPIQDNSFLIEEAYNQENGIVQHISFVQRSLSTGDWVYAQTDEWPLRSPKHQLSLTLSASHSGAYAGSGIGWSDSAINYRYQLVGDGESRLAIAPRITALLPSGNFRLGRGSGSSGLQVNFPISLQPARRLVTHWNAGFTWVLHARNARAESANSLSTNLGYSLVWLATHRVNGLLETLWTSSAEVTAANQTTRRQQLFVCPGIRWSFNFSNGLQIVPGVGSPIGIGRNSGRAGLILYLSFEHPWRIAQSR